MEKEKRYKLADTDTGKCMVTFGKNVLIDNDRGMIKAWADECRDREPYIHNTLDSVEIFALDVNVCRG